jgi:hypothetical protein
MSNRFSSAKHSIAECDICGFRFKLKVLKKLVIKTKEVAILACPECWSPDHPQLQLGMYPVSDPQAVREPRPDQSYPQSRNIQWGFNPVGGASSFDSGLTPNNLTTASQVGSVSVVTT